MSNSNEKLDTEHLRQQILTDLLNLQTLSSDECPGTTLLDEEMACKNLGNFRSLLFTY